jgi:MSHA biogenesis protein MshN
MSLINKMLQDLDARGGGKDAALEEPALKAVPAYERDRRPMLLAGAGVTAVVVLAAGGWYGWQYWKGHSAPPGPVPRVVDNRVPDRPRFQEPPAAVAPIAAPNAALSEQAPAAALSEQTPAAALSERTPAAALSGQAPAPALSKQTQAAFSGQAPAAALQEQTPAAALSRRAPAAALSEQEPAAVEPGHVAAIAKPKRPAPGADAAGERELAAAAPARVRKPAQVATSSAASADAVVSDLTPKQVADNTYRRALASLQEGRVSSALADLDKALEIDPRNDGARQTYVSLLLEIKRTDDAMRQLRLALGIEPRQPGLAMVLARLQLEKGGPALETLMTTLPYARNSADYQGFLAGVLQREQRHAEAAQYYREALKISPSNGIWWMGLGISLQAEQHLPEAREAYTRARAANGLTPELQAFIERKLEQLAR